MSQPRTFYTTFRFSIFGKSWLPPHWLTHQKGVHQLRYFLSLMRTPHLSRQLVFLLSKCIFCYYCYCNIHINNWQQENISVSRHIFVLQVMTYWYDVRIQAFMVYALSVIMKYGNQLEWQQNIIRHSSMQTSRNAFLMEANAKLWKLFKFLRIHALIITKLLYFYKKYRRLECVHHDDLNYVHQVVVCHNWPR